MNRVFLCALLCVGLGVTVVSVLAQTPAPGAAPGATAAAPAATVVKPTSDWPCWRGPYHNGITASTQKWSATWPAEGPKKLWTTKIGIGYSSPVVVGGKVFLGGFGVAKLGGKKDWDTLYCLNADTGEIVWQQALPNTGVNIGAATTPSVDGNVVYMVSNACGVGAYDVQTGKEIWTHDMGQDGVKATERRCWCTAPIVEGNVIVLNGGTSGIGLDKATGKVAWKSDPDVAPFMSSVPFDTNGQLLVLMVTGKNIVAVKPADGTVVFGSTRKEISWKVSGPDMFADPVVQGSDVEFCGAWLTLKDGKVVLNKEGDKKRNLDLGSTCQPILYNGCIYAPHAYKSFNSKLDEYGYRCRDWATGEIKWEQKGVCGQQILVDDKLVILGIDGTLVIAQATPEKYVELGRAPIFPGYKDGTRESHCLVAPAFADGRVYLRKDNTVVCVDLRQN